METLADTLKKRIALEKQAQLKHTVSQNIESRSNKSLLIVSAVLVAAFYAVAVNIYWRLEYSAAKPGQILAKSEMTPQEIKNIKKAMK
jgi:hypothetical protein